MEKPRIFLGSSGKQEKLLKALTHGLEDVAHVEPWTTSFNPGTTTLDRLLELTHEVDFAALAFAQDDWTTASPPVSTPTGSGQASPRDNVVFEAGLLGGVLGMRRTFILHANGAKLLSDLLLLTCVRYGGATTPTEMKIINENRLRRRRSTSLVSVGCFRPQAHIEAVVRLLFDALLPQRGQGHQQQRALPVAKQLFHRQHRVPVEKAAEVSDRERQQDAQKHIAHDHR